MIIQFILIGFVIYCYSTQIGVPGGKTGNMFINVPIEVTCYQPETVGCMLYLFIWLWYIVLIVFMNHGHFSVLCLLYQFNVKARLGSG